MQVAGIDSANLDIPRHNSRFLAAILGVCLHQSTFGVQIILPPAYVNSMMTAESSSHKFRCSNLVSVTLRVYMHRQCQAGLFPTDDALPIASHGGIVPSEQTLGESSHAMKVHTC